MRKAVNHKYADISSFEDFRFEMEKIMFRRKLAEAKLNLAYLKFTHFISVSGATFSFLKDVVLPKVSEILRDHGEKKKSKSDAAGKTKTKGRTKQKTSN